MNVLTEHLTVIAKYESEGVSLMTPPANELLSRYTDKRKLLIEKDIKEQISAIYNKTSTFLSTKSKITETNKILTKIMAWRSEYSNENIEARLDDEEKAAAKIVHDLQLSAYLEEADKAIFMNQKSKALNKFQEALYFIKTDKIPDDYQSKTIAEIEKKIADIK